MTRAWTLLIALLAAPAAHADVSDKPILVLDAGGHTARVTKVLWMPDGKGLLTISDDKTVRIWDIHSGETVHVFRPPIGLGSHGMLYTASISADGRLLARRRLWTHGRGAPRLPHRPAHRPAGP